MFASRIFFTPAARKRGIRACLITVGMTEGVLQLSCCCTSSIATWGFPRFESLWQACCTQPSAFQQKTLMRYGRTIAWVRAWRHWRGGRAMARRCLGSEVKGIWRDGRQKVCTWNKRIFLAACGCQKENGGTDSFLLFTFLMKIWSPLKS